MATSPQVFIFHSAMTSAPSMFGSTAGSLISVLSACLVDGFGSQTVTAFTVASGIGTVTVTTGTAFPQYYMIQISGNTNGTYASTINAKFRVTSNTATTVSFAIAIPDGTYYTAGMTCMVAPIGWTRPFTPAGNIAVYRSSDTTGNQHYLRVNDSFGQYANVSGYVTMTDLNTGTGAYATNSANPFWRKFYQTNASAAPWFLIGDGKTFYFATSPTFNTLNNLEFYGFGDISSLLSGDTFGSFLASSSCASTLTGNYTTLFNQWVNAGVCTLAKSYTGSSSNVNFHQLGDGWNTTSGVLMGSVGYAFPNSPNNAIVLKNNIKIVEYNNSTASFNILRGYLRGAYQVMHATPLNPFDTITLPNGNVGIYLGVGNGNTATAGGCIVFDIMGAW